MSEGEAMQVLDRLREQGVEPRGLSVDSRAIAPGDVFLAYPGARTDGRRHVESALSAGAAAVLWEEDGYAWPAQLRAPNLGVRGLRELAGPLAHLIYGRPSEKLWTVGVTGTNGKTSVSQWIARCLDSAGTRCAVIGTLGAGFPGALRETVNTTPEAVGLHRSLAEFLERGASAAAMEVSSIGLDQGRANGIRFACAALTNLTRDHLEYHGTMEAYARAKARLFSMPGLRHAVLNLDDALGRALAPSLKGNGLERIGYTLRPEASDGLVVDRMLVASDIRVTADGLEFNVGESAERARVAARLVGRFNVSNLLAVLCVLRAAGMELAEAAARVSALTPPPGRMQMLGGACRPLVVVDYAHSPDALEQALGALRETSLARAGRLICVFGCGGDRDPGKRPEMGAVAARGADRVWITTDNPRSEEPGAILAQIAAGASEDVQIVEDRARAIALAVGSAGERDVVLIAGKGHENYQEARGVRAPFSDLDEAARALATWREDAR